VKKLHFSLDFLKQTIDFSVLASDYPNSSHANGPSRLGGVTEMDINANFIENHSRYFIESRAESFRNYRYGNGSAVAAMIASAAAGVRKAAATIERWARGTNVTVKEYRLPRPNSAR